MSFPTFPPQPYILNFTPTGMVSSRATTPHVPLQPEEIAEQVQQAVELGITLVHLHARDKSGAPTTEAEIYADIISRIRSFAPELVICVSLSGRRQPNFEARAAALTLTRDLKPDMGSLTLSSLNFSQQTSINAPETIQLLASEMLRRGIVPELEIFDSGMVNYALYLTRKGLLSKPYFFNIILGGLAGAQADPLDLGNLLARLPQPNLWACGGLGRAQTTAILLGLGSGGGVRMGLEDNIYFDARRTDLATNLALLQRTHRIAGEIGRPLMTPAEFRNRMAMAPGRGSYGRLQNNPDNTL